MKNFFYYVYLLTFSSIKLTKTKRKPIPYYEKFKFLKRTNSLIDGYSFPRCNRL